MIATLFSHNIYVYMSNVFFRSEDADCIATKCTKKTKGVPPSDLQCGPILDMDKGYPDSQHSINVFQQSCSVDGVSDADDGEISVCCKPEAKDGMHPLTVNVHIQFINNIVSNDSKQNLYFYAGILLAGYGAESHEFPHQAQIVTKRPRGTVYGPFIGSRCGSTIYNENWIITAA
jgi:hypothetical protein